jgi:4-carboxymuconolactone decarboxylase
MSKLNFNSPREAARAFTPKLAQFVDSTLYPQIWSDPALSPRDRSLITVAAANGVTQDEMAAAITHLAFYVGFPGAITASAIANATFSAKENN